MNYPTNISIDRVRLACQLLLDHLAQSEGKDIPIERDFFWSISDEILYDVYNEPNELTIGQVSESWGHLEDLLDGRTATPSRHLSWLADVIRALGSPSARKPLNP